MASRKEKIINEALQLLNESGIEGVTLRKLAKRLDIYASALYWHFKNKEALVNEMAEAILRMEFSEIQSPRNNEQWQDWLIDIFNRLRNVLLAYKDGGRVVAGAHLSLTMAKITEEAIKTIYNAGLSLHKSRLIVLTATRYTFGHVIEEQNSPSAAAIDDFDNEQFKKDHPIMIKAIEQYYDEGLTVDDLFNDGLEIIVSK